MALAKKPEDRYQSATEMLADIQTLRAGRAVSTKIARPPMKMQWRVLSTLLVAAILIGGLVAIAVYTTKATKGNDLVEMPYVVGLTQAEATEQLPGFVITIQHAHDPKIPIDLVASQVPAETTKIKTGTGVVLTISDGPGDAVVPVDLIGKTLVDARASLAAVGLVVKQTQAVPSEKPQGVVLKVTPSGGSTVIAGSGVILQIASGDVEVPPLLGLDEIQARTVLTQAGFIVKLVDATDLTQPAGIVIAQAPDAGTAQTIGSAVTITVNRTEPTDTTTQ